LRHQFAFVFVSWPIGAVAAALDPLLLKPGDEGSRPQAIQGAAKTAKDDRRRWRAPREQAEDSQIIR
jgi:hypothetical protein